MICLKNITKHYHKKENAVHNMNWEISDGCITGFIGQNGAGKSTTLKMITGCISPSSGTITVNNCNILTNPIEAKKQIGFVSDSPNHFLRLTAFEYISFIASVYQVPPDTANERLLELSNRFDIIDMCNQPISVLSHGTRQKVMIIASLIHDPSIWILDEPMVGLDPPAIITLKEIMKKRANQGKCVLFSTHILEVAEHLCSSIGIIHQGSLIFSGQLTKLHQHYPNDSLEDIFITLTKKKE